MVNAKTLVTINLFLVSCHLVVERFRVHGLLRFVCHRSARHKVSIEAWLHPEIVSTASSKPPTNRSLIVGRRSIEEDEIFTSTSGILIRLVLKAAYQA